MASAVMGRAIAGALVLAACAPLPAPRGATGAASAEGIDAAFEAVAARARRCLGAADVVGVEGFFDGRSGMFLVEQVTAESAATPVRVQQCVSLAMERARVRPFDAARSDARYSVSSRGARALVLPTPAAVAPEVVGEVDAAAVLALLRAEQPEARRCYEDALRGDPRLAGRVEVRFTLSVDGRVTHAVASGPPGFRAVGHCIVGHLRALQWPAARGGSVDFVFPYGFAPRR